MSTALQSYDKLIAANFDDKQARAILDAMASDLVTKDFLDSRLATLKTELMLALLTVCGLILGSMYFVLPRILGAVR